MKLLHPFMPSQRSTINKIKNKIEMKYLIIYSSIKKLTFKLFQKDAQYPHDISKSYVEKLQNALYKRSLAIEKLKSNRDDLRERIVRQRAQVDRMRGHVQMFSKNLAINRYLAFAQTVDDLAKECRADVYVAHGVQALPAVDRLKQLNGGSAVCDVIEIPSFAKRAVPSKLDPSVLKMIDHGLAGYLKEANYLITVGWALGDLISKEHSDIRVIPNYRKFEEFSWNTKIREGFGIPSTASVVLCISTIASGFGDVLRALAQLDEDVHLVTIGKFVPDAYREEIENLRDALNLRGRVHFRGPVPYEELGSLCSGADAGLIVLDPSIANNFISLPNRLFDYLASNLPIVSPMMPDIHRIINEYECGVTIDDITPAAWAEGIRQALAQKEAMRRNAAAAAAKLTWESLEQDILHKAFNNAGSVTFVGFNNLAQNNRTMRMAASLANQGVKVKVASPMEETDVLPDGVIPIRMQKV